MVKQRKNLKKLKIPFYDDGNSDEGHFTVNTLEEKIVCKYTGYNFDRLEDLEVFEFWLLLRDAVIYDYKQTEGGNEYLDNCWRMEQTSPDRKSLREKMGRKEE
ncbi:MAG: hypothetical protein ACREV6_19440 [Clostridium sp.]|uniref:hypothetical protein n=1 Tax=Clostridium sp. TaxID=1506 RepID=UPI003D6CD36D